MLYVVVTSGTTPVALNLNGALVAAESLTRILTSPADVLPVPAPSAIPVEPVPFSLAASINCV